MRVTEKIKVPKWFDKIYKELEYSVRFNWGVLDAEQSTKLILVNAIAHQGFVSVWTDTVMEEVRIPTSDLKKMIIENEENKIDYVEKHKFDLIKAIIDGYEVEEEKYVVVSKNCMIERQVKPPIVTGVILGSMEPLEFEYIDVKKYSVFYQNNGIEKGATISEEQYNNLLHWNVADESIQTMNNKEADSLLNDYRLKIKVK